MLARVAVAKEGPLDRATALAAIRADPDDRSLRLAYADALEAEGEADRAEWIRASCDYATIKLGDPRWGAAVDRLRHALWKCQPAWWESLKNVDQRDDRGMFRLILGGERSSRAAAPYKRLGKVAWLGIAYSEGWLQRIELDFCDDELIDIVAKWKEPASTIPLFVRPAPQADDATLRKILALKQLEGLSLETATVRLPAVRELASYANLVDLKIELRNVEGEVVDAVLGQLERLPNLRRLHLIGHDRPGHGDRPNDADLVRFEDSKKLKRLIISSAPAVTESGIAAFKKSRPDVVVNDQYRVAG
jgi:uncharacterized protein (TIGR02996 family)